MDNCIALFFAGDVFAAGEPHEKGIIGEELLKKMNSHDFRSCNFEAPVKAAGSEPVLKAGPAIFQRESVAKVLVDAGFDLFNIANNHIMDFGVKSLENTISMFKNVHVIGAGLNFTEANKNVVKEIKGVKFSFLAFAEWGFGASTGPEMPGFAWINSPCADQIIVDAKRNCDFLIVQAHAGVEEIDLPLPEWRRRFKKLIELGADAVICHHPHVPQGVEIYRGKPIFYSLGNFYFDYNGADKAEFWDYGYCVSLKFENARYKGFEIIAHRKKDGVVEVCADEKILTHLLKLNEMLSESVYEPKIGEMVEWLWQNRYLKFYNDSLGVKTDFTFFETVKLMIKKIMGIPAYKQEIKGPLLCHNLAIESHRWAVQRYCALKGGFLY